MDERVPGYLDYEYPKIQILIKQIIEILRENLRTPFRIYVFGSFATGKASYFSDLDVAIETEQKLSDVELINIRKSLDELRTLRKIDFIYLNNVPESLRKTVEKEGILVYEFKG
jgi:predicted nucleotidyltransferase